MKVEFLQDFRGIETNEHYYNRGVVVDLDTYSARSLIGDGFAIEAPANAVPVEVESTPEDAAADTYSLLDIDGVGESRLEELRELGVATVVDLAHVSAGTLTRGLNRVGQKQAKNWIAQAQAMLNPLPEGEAG